MKDSLAHLPQIKADELELTAFNIRALCDDVQMVILFGSYARGDFKNGPHEQGRGRLIIHKRSDYDILVLTANEYTARDIALWDKVKEKLAESNLSTHVRIIARDIDFVNYKLRQGQYFFTEICKQGILLYNSGRFQLNKKQELSTQPKQNKSPKTLSAKSSKAQRTSIVHLSLISKRRCTRKPPSCFTKPPNSHTKPPS